MPKKPFLNDIIKSTFIPSVIYFSLSLFVITGGLFELPMLVYICKPLLMPVLGLTFLFGEKIRNKKLFYSIAFALLFAFFGDVFLMFGSNFFILGLLSFLITHLIYILIFCKGLVVIIDSKFIIVLAVFALFYLFLIQFLFSYLNELLIPVCIYGLALVLMGFGAFLRPPNLGYRDVLFGASLFILSDSILALNQFIYNSSLKSAQVFVILLYVLAQYFIVKGLLKKAA